MNRKTHPLLKSDVWMEYMEITEISAAEIDKVIKDKIRKKMGGRRKGEAHG